MQSHSFQINLRIRSGHLFLLSGDDGKCAVIKSTVCGQFAPVSGWLRSVSSDKDGFAWRRAYGDKDLFCGRSDSLRPLIENQLRRGLPGKHSTANFWSPPPEDGRVPWRRTRSDPKEKGTNQLELDDDDYKRGPKQIVTEDQRPRKAQLALTAIALSLAVFLAPSPDLTNFTVSNSARADQFGQLRQVASILGRAGEGLSKIRLDRMGLDALEKAATVVTGATSVDPGSLDQEVNGILNGQKDVNEELRNGIQSAVENSWSTIVNIVTDFNPTAITESAGASISSLLEAGAERVAAFELSSLVFVGERWLILAPLVAIPMAWEMKRNKKKSERKSRGEQGRSEKLSLQVQLRGQKVRRELERIELRALILDAVSSLGKAALQPAKTTEEAGLIRRRIKDLLERLEELKPVEDPSLLVPELASALASQAVPSDALAYVPTTPTVDGDWRLIYVSEATEASRPQELPQFPGIGSTFPGVGLDNLRQKVWQATSVASVANDDSISTPLVARNTVDVRLGPIGVFRLATEGQWENSPDGRNTLASFTSFSARPTEILGNRVSDDVPELLLTIPEALQRRLPQHIAYVDDHLRVNRTDSGELFLFQRVEEPYRAYS